VDTLKSVARVSRRANRQSPTSALVFCATIGPADPLFEEAPVDRAVKPTQVDDLVEPEGGAIPSLLSFLCRIESRSAKRTERQNHVQRSDRFEYWELAFALTRRSVGSARSQRR
jgi:hypothetical protein